MKKMIALLLCLVMIVGMLVGCKPAAEAPDDTQSTKPASSEADNTEAAETKPEYVHIPIVFFGAPTSRSAEFFENEFNERMKEELNITIEISYLNWGEYDKLEAMLASGESFVFMTPGSQVARFAQKGYMAEITEELIKEVAPDLMDARMGKDFTGCKYQGTNYIIPVGCKVSSGAQDNLSIRNDLLNAVGLDYTDIKTFEDLTDAYLKVREKFPDVRMGFFDRFPCNVEEGDPVTMKSGEPDLVYTDHADADSDEIFGSLTSDFFKKYLEQLYVWKELGFFDDEEWITDPNYYMTLWNSGLSLITYGQSKYMLEHDLTGVAGADVRYLKIENNQHVSGYSYDWGWAVSAEGEEYIEPMLRLLNWIFASKDNYNFAVNGVEGKDWEYAEDGVTVNKLVADEFFYDWQHQTLKYMDATKYDPEDWEFYSTHDSKAIPNKLIGFAFDTTPVQTELAAVSAVSAGGKSWLLYDSYEEWAAEMLPKLEAAGYQKIVDEIQKQVSAWWAENH